MRAFRAWAARARLQVLGQLSTRLGCTSGFGLSEELKTLNLSAVVMVFVAVIAMLNSILGGIGGLVGVELTMQGILGWLFAPFAFLMGIPWHEATAVGTLLGEKLVLTGTQLDTRVVLIECLRQVANYLPGRAPQGHTSRQVSQGISSLMNQQ